MFFRRGSRTNSKTSNPDLSSAPESDKNVTSTDSRQSINDIGSVSDVSNSRQSVSDLKNGSANGNGASATSSPQGNHNNSQTVPSNSSQMTATSQHGNGNGSQKVPSSEPISGGQSGSGKPSPPIISSPSSSVTPPASPSKKATHPDPHPSLRKSIKPDGLVVGIRASILLDEDEQGGETPRLSSKEVADPSILADQLNNLLDCYDELNIKNRDNNSILCQMMFTMEEKITKRIDSVRDECLALIDRKVELMSIELKAQQQTINVLQQQIAAGGGSGIAVSVGGESRAQRRSTVRHNSNISNSSAYNPTGSLSNLFDSVPAGDSSSVDGGRSHHSSLAVPPAKRGSESSMAVTGTAPEGTYRTEKIDPIPGFVIKTRKIIGEKEKIFINVFHHDSIELVPANLPKGISPNDKPFFVVGEITCSLDKDGHNCYTYNVGVSSDYFKPETSAEIDFKITAPSSIQKVRESLFSLTLVSYSLPASCSHSFSCVTFSLFFS
jgi:hypothetical protein